MRELEQLAARMSCDSRWAVTEAAYRLGLRHGAEPNEKAERVFQAVVYAYEGREVPPDLLSHGMVRRALKFRARQHLTEPAADRENLIDMLCAVEWVRQGSGNKYACAFCGGVCERDGGPGHADDCRWQQAVLNPIALPDPPNDCESYMAGHREARHDAAELVTTLAAVAPPSGWQPIDEEVSAQLREIVALGPQMLATLRKHGYRFERFPRDMEKAPPNGDGERWEAMAFSIYTTLNEAVNRAQSALDAMELPDPPSIPPSPPEKA